MTFSSPVQNRSRVAIGLGAALLLILALGWHFSPNAFFRGYWMALMFWMQLSVGAWVVLLLQALTGGEWGRAATPFLRAAAAGVYLLIPLFLPALFALSNIFSWTHIEVGVSSPALINKLPWLNPTAFIIRTLFYLAALGAMISLRRRNNLSTLAGPMLVFTIVLFSFYSADWMMSLQPTFYSSLYPFLYFSGAMVSIFSVLCGLAAATQLRQKTAPNPGLLLALGKLLFASVLFWGYLVFSQFIIIWTGNLPDEAEWYVVRSEPAWLWLTLLVLAAHFAIPFCLLLSQTLKKNARQLLTVSVVLFVMHLLEVFWLMRPTPGFGFRFSVFDVLMPLCIGACWLLFVFRDGADLVITSTGENREA
jgi:hypothetical protein